MKKSKNSGKKFTVIIITAFIVFSMVISIFAIVVDNQSQGIPKYNKHSFVSTDTGYKTKINGAYMDFYNYPTELEHINMSSDVTALIQNSKGMAFIFNPEDNLSDNLKYIDLIRYDLMRQIDNPVFFGITQESDKYDLPIVSCANATNSFPFVMINSSIEQGFYISSENPNCIIMNAKLLGLLSTKDRLVYTYYGVMN
jgi:hypothetical protein